MLRSDYIINKKRYIKIKAGRDIRQFIPDIDITTQQDITTQPGYLTTKKEERGNLKKYNNMNRKELKQTLSVEEIQMSLEHFFYPGQIDNDVINEKITNNTGGSGFEETKSSYNEYNLFEEFFLNDLNLLIDDIKLFETHLSFLITSLKNIFIEEPTDKYIFENIIMNNAQVFYDEKSSDYYILLSYHMKHETERINLSAVLNWNTELNKYGTGLLEYNIVDKIIKKQKVTLNDKFIEGCLNFNNLTDENITFQSLYLLKKKISINLQNITTKMTMNFSFDDSNNFQKIKYTYYYDFLVESLENIISNNNFFQLKLKGGYLIDQLTQDNYNFKESKNQYQKDISISENKNDLFLGDLDFDLDYLHNPHVKDLIDTLYPYLLDRYINNNISIFTELSPFQIKFINFKDNLIKEYNTLWKRLLKMNLNEDIAANLFKKMYNYLEIYLESKSINVKISPYCVDEELIYQFEENQIINNSNENQEKSKFLKITAINRNFFSYIKLDNIGGYKFKYNNTHIYNKFNLIRLNSKFNFNINIHNSFDCSITSKCELLDLGMRLPDAFQEMNISNHDYNHINMYKYNFKKSNYELKTIGLTYIIFELILYVISVKDRKQQKRKERLKKIIEKINTEQMLEIGQIEINDFYRSYLKTLESELENIENYKDLLDYIENKL